MKPHPSRAIPPLLVLAAAAAAGCSGDPSDPAVGLRNDSDSVLRVSFWVGDRADAQDGSATLRCDRHSEVRPGAKVRYSLSSDSGYRSFSESFVRVQIEPIGSSFERLPQYWFELNPPPPYTLRAYGVRPNIKFDRVPPTAGGMIVVPRELWINTAP